MPQFDANIYVIFFLSGLVEIPADIIPFVLLNRSPPPPLYHSRRFGRRPNLSLHYIIGGLLCMATAAVPLGVYSYEWPIVVLAMLGKYVAQVCWGIVYLYTSELFPTVIRSVALSFACSMARIGSMAAPFIAYLAELHPVLPIFVFGSITFVVRRHFNKYFDHHGRLRLVSQQYCCPRQTRRSCLTPWRKVNPS